MPNYDINYDDERFKAVENEKQSALTKVNNTYDDMIEKSDKFYQDQINASKDYVNKQTEIQEKNTQQVIDKINQQKEQETQDYLKEQSGAYVDWRKQSNNYGVNAEEMASNGLQNTGYSETSQVSMYNAYQNRIATSRESFKRITLNYDNAMKDAILANSSALLEIANKGLEKQLELALSGFQYKNTLLDKKLEQEQTTEDRYYSKWKDILSQINSENTLKENIRQYENNMLYQKERDRIADSQWRQEYNLSLAKSYGSSNSNTSKTYEVNTPYYQGKKNSDCQYGTFGTKDNNGISYQPNNIGKNKDGDVQYLKSSGKTVAQMYGAGRLQGATGANIDNQIVWKYGKNYYIWDGSQNQYIKMN